MQNTKMGFKDLLIRFSKRHSIYLVLLGVILVSICLSDSFTRPANILNITRQISVSTIVAYGMTIIIICGMIDLSAGSVIALAGVLGVMTYVQTQSVLLAVLVSMLIGAATGAVFRVDYYQVQSPRVHNDHGDADVRARVGIVDYGCNPDLLDRQGFRIGKGRGFWAYRFRYFL